MLDRHPRLPADHRPAASRQIVQTRRRAPLQEAQRLTSEELAGLQKIADEGFASINWVREPQGLGSAQGPAGRRGSGIRPGRRSDRRDAHAIAVSVRDQLEKIETDFNETQSKLSEVLPKLVATREQLEHSLVRAPAKGQVVGLTVFTIGGLVAPGQKLMDVVADGRELVIQAQLNPSDAEDAYAGPRAQVRFTTGRFRSFSGTGWTVSANSFADEDEAFLFLRRDRRIRKRD